ncbi:MAG TPA: hypothetical protein VKF35_16030, partial [Hyphomicrobiaceae bacterium]|nr:hypothetical protein [Hyphomicrobiaceae bacterium]
MALPSAKAERNRFGLKRCGSSILIEHDLFGKPASTFPDHALRRIRAVSDLCKFACRSARVLRRNRNRGWVGVVVAWHARKAAAV